jgi:hypothetical protein
MELHGVIFLLTDVQLHNFHTKNVLGTNVANFFGTKIYMEMSLIFIVVVVIGHRPVFHLNHIISESGFYLLLQVNLLGWA